MHDVVYRCSSHHLAHSVPVFATSACTQCAVARQINYHIPVAYRCSSHHAPHSVTLLAAACTSSLDAGHRCDASSNYAGRGPPRPQPVAMQCVPCVCRVEGCVVLMCVCVLILMWCGVVLVWWCIVKRGARPRHGCKAMAMLASHRASTADGSPPRKIYLTSCWKFQHIRY